MRLLVLADPFLPIPPLHYGGIERIIALLLESARDAGHEIVLLAHPDSQIEGVRVIPFSGAPRPTLRDQIRNAQLARRTVATFRPDLIHCFARLAYLTPFFSSSLPKIMAYHREPAPLSIRGAARLSRSLTFTGCSESLTRRGASHGGKWQAIPNGLDLSLYTFQPRVAADAPLVFLSRIERVKGAHLAIAAARATGRRLVIAGNHADSGPEAEYWRREIAPHLDRDGIAYVGTVDDRQKNELLGRARALLVPIEWEEPFGMVFGEALACGTPVISMRRGALPELIEHDREGFLCDQLAELIDAVGKVAHIDRAACRARAETRFSRELMWSRTERLYSQLITGACCATERHPARRAQISSPTSRKMAS